MDFFEESRLKAMKSVTQHTPHELIEAGNHGYELFLDNSGKHNFPRLEGEETIDIFRHDPVNQSSPTAWVSDNEYWLFQFHPSIAAKENVIQYEANSIEQLDNREDQEKTNQKNDPLGGERD